MMWNYRRVRHLDGSYSLRRIHYDNDRKPLGMSCFPPGFTCTAEDDPQEIVDELFLAYQDARDHPPFEEPKEWSDGSRYESKEGRWPILDRLAWNGTARIMSEEEFFVEALKHAREALEELERLFADDPCSPKYQQRLIKAKNWVNTLERKWPDA